jgi:tetratricopeptide (TPR) repeat protein
MTKLFISILILTLLLTGCVHSPLQNLQRAEVFAGEGKYEQAIDLCSDVLSTDSTVQIAYYYRGRYYAYLRKFAEAVSDFNKVIDLQPYHNGAYLMVSRNSIIATEEDKLKVTGEEALFQRAIIEYYMGHLIAAEKDFTICLGNGFDEYGAFYTTGQCYTWLGTIANQRGEREKGCNFYTQAIIKGDTAVTRLIEIYCR